MVPGVVTGVQEDALPPPQAEMPPVRAAKSRAMPSMVLPGAAAGRDAEEEQAGENRAALRIPRDAAGRLIDGDAGGGLACRGGDGEGGRARAVGGDGDRAGGSKLEEGAFCAPDMVVPMMAVKVTLPVKPGLGCTVIVEVLPVVAPAVTVTAVPEMVKVGPCATVTVCVPVAAL